MKKLLGIVLAGALLAATLQPGYACTGIAINAADGTKLLARTIEWKGGNLQSKLIVLPRGMQNTALTPAGKNGHSWTNKYGAVGASTVAPEFSVDDTVLIAAATIAATRRPEAPVGRRWTMNHGNTALT